MTEMTEAPIHTQADLERTWRTLMTPLGFGGYSCWLMMLEPDRRPIPQLTEIEDTDRVPNAAEADGLAHVLGRLAADGIGSVAFLRTRPGRDGVTPRDRRYAAVLYDAARRADLPIEVVHLANDVDLWPLPMDDVTMAAPA